MSHNLTFDFGVKFRSCLYSFCNVQKRLPLVVLSLRRYIVIGSDVWKPPPPHLVVSSFSC